MATLTLTRSTRTLAVGSTNSVHTVRRPNPSDDYLAVDPVRPDMAGRPSTPRVVLAEYHAIRRRNASNDYAVTFFIGGRRVVSGSREFALDLSDLVDGRTDSLTVEVA